MRSNYLEETLQLAKEGYYDMEELWGFVGAIKYSIPYNEEDETYDNICTLAGTEALICLIIDNGGMEKLIQHYIDSSRVIENEGDFVAIVGETMFEEYLKWDDYLRYLDREVQSDINVRTSLGLKP